VTALSLMMLLVVPPADAAAVKSAVTEFYSVIIKDPPIGLPTGAVKAALEPRMSRRLVRQLRLAQECEKDYFRLHSRRTPAAEDGLPPTVGKPSFGWLEHGLFSGGNEQAMPKELDIQAVEPLPDGGFRVRVEFTYRDSFATYGRPPDDSNTFRWPGIVIVVREHGDFVIDDFVEIEWWDAKKGQRPLSAAFEGCSGGRWVGLKDRDD
jgi:hypothetical protein